MTALGTVLRRAYARPKRRWGQAVQLAALRLVAEPRIRWRLRQPGDVVLIHQVGKTGSKAIEAALAQAGLARRTFHTHILNEDDRARLRAERRTGRWSPPLSWVVSELLLNQVVDRPDRHRLLVICPIREPVGRNVSAFFYSADPDYLSEKADLPADERVTLIRRDFLTTWDHDRVLEWLTRELEDQLGYDLSTGFDVAGGCSSYENAAGGRCLVLRQEDLDAVAPAALSEFLGRQVGAVPRTNAASDRAADASLYAEFCSQATLPSDYVDRMYGSAFATTYYSPDELATLTTRWTGRVGDGERRRCDSEAADR